MKRKHFFYQLELEPLPRSDFFNMAVTAWHGHLGLAIHTIFWLHTVGMIETEQGNKLGCVTCLIDAYHKGKSNAIR